VRYEGGGTTPCATGRAPKRCAVETCLYDAGDITSGFSEDVLQVLAARCRLFGDAALDDVALGVGRKLAGDEDVWACDHGLGLEAASVTMIVQRGASAVHSNSRRAQ